MRSIVCSTFAVACSVAAAVSAGPGGMIQGKLVCRGVRDCSGAVVYVENIQGLTFAPPQKEVVMDQLNLTFVPHVLPVVVGTRVAFPNGDEVRHNVFSPSPAKRFNLGTYPKGVTKHVVFDKPGVVELLCNVHAEMSAYVVVTETPYTVLVNRDGTYVLKDVPAGTYTVRAWREELKDARQQVTIRDGETATLNFDLRR